MRAYTSTLVAFVMLALGASAHAKGPAKATKTEDAKAIVYAKAFSLGLAAPFGFKLGRKVEGTKGTYRYSAERAPETGKMTGLVNISAKSATVHTRFRFPR